MSKVVQNLGPREFARRRRTVWAFCKSCGHSARMQPYEHARTIGHDVSLRELESRLACQRCGRRSALVAVDDTEVLR